MSDEIKEILDRLEKIGFYASVPKELAYMTTNITPQECKTILDYITNLQQKSQTLQENNQSMQEEMARVWEKENDYKSRCEKADELLELKQLRYLNEPEYRICTLDLQEVRKILQEGKYDNDLPTN